MSQNRGADIYLIFQTGGAAGGVAGIQVARAGLSQQFPPKLILLWWNLFQRNVQFNVQRVGPI